MDKAVLWDLDGTILDSMTVMNSIINVIFPKIGLSKLDREAIRKDFYGPLEESLARMSNNYSDQEELLALYLEEQLGYYDNPLTHEGIIDAIEKFSELGLKQAVVTSRKNQGRDSAGAREVIHTLELDLHLPVIVTGDDIVNHKPHPEPLEKALRQLNVEAQNCVMIGDQPVDIAAANAIGAASIYIDYDKSDSEQLLAEGNKPNMTCHDAGQIIKAVKKLLQV